MGTDRSREAHAGLLVVDPRLRDGTCIWDAQSSYSQAGGRPGTPVPAQVSQLTLQATGTTTGGTDVEVLAQRSGLPEPGGGAYVWRNAGDTLYRGCDVPTVITGWEAVEWTSGAVLETVKSTTDPHAVTMPDGTVVCVVQRRHVPTVTSQYEVAAYVRSPDDGTWADSIIYSSTTSPTFGYHPCVVLLPNGRLLCYYLVEDVAADEVQVGMAYSEDGGATWTEGSPGVLRTPIDVSGSPGAAADGGDPGRMRAAHANGQVMLVVEYQLHDTSVDQLDSFIQYASDDLGCRFSQVGDPWDGDNASEGGGRFHDILIVGGRFAMVYIRADTIRPSIRWAGSAYDRLAEVSPVYASTLGLWAVHTLAAPGDEITDGDLAASERVNDFETPD